MFSFSSMEKFSLLEGGGGGGWKLFFHADDLKITPKGAIKET
jgi:hypothetical protein